MTDTVERLRHFQRIFTRPEFPKEFHDMGDEIGNAADEIERLRETLGKIAKFAAAVAPKPTKELAAIRNEALSVLIGGDR